MTLEETEKRMRIIFNELLELRRQKGHDYAGERDSINNLRDFGWRGVIVRISDKYHRLKNFVKHNKLEVKDETIDDTLKDLIVYGFLALIMKGENRESE